MASPEEAERLLDLSESLSRRGRLRIFGNFDVPDKELSVTEIIGLCIDIHFIKEKTDNLFNSSFLYESIARSDRNS